MSPPSPSPSTSRPPSAAATTSVVQLGAEADAPLPIDGRSHPSLLAIGRLVGRRLRVRVVLSLFVCPFGRETERGKKATEQKKRTSTLRKKSKKTSKQVTVSDGRVLSGVLSCLDPQGNLVLADTLTLGGERGGGGGGLGEEAGKKAEERGEGEGEKRAPSSSSGEAATAATTTAAATEAHAPLSLDDGHHHSRNQQQDHAMGMVIVPRSKRVRCCVEVESFEVERVGAEVARAMESSK